ncbi:MAG TPA: 2-oxo acid dehydrogenase subunit E2 [Terriglobia bacterium]|nr:2-oxo acid dehydrogenase subunit E2 [Terriglobia bacterium]
MTTEFRLPELGENVEKGDLVKVLVAVGDVITKDQSVLELETEKATLEVPSSVGGKVRAIHVNAGEKVKVGQLILTVEDGAQPRTRASGIRTEPAPDGATPAPGKPPDVPKPTQVPVSAEFRLPELGENVEKGDLIKVLVSVGDAITKDQPVLELETEKATLEVPSAVSGRVTAIHVKAGDKVKVGQLILAVEGKAPSHAAGTSPTAEAVTPADKAASPKALVAHGEPTGRPGAAATMRVVSEPTAAVPSSGIVPALSTNPLVPAAPSVRRLARELGVEIGAVPGTGPGGRISAEDVKGYVKRLNLGRAAPAGFASVLLPDFTRWGSVQREPMRAVRRATAAHLTHAWVSVPRVTQHEKADITQLEQFRKQYAKNAEERGAKPTVTAFALKVVASAVKIFPQFAATLDPAREEIVYKKYCHIGVAVDTDRGLLVPVIRDVDQKNIIELSVELAAAAAKARDRKLAPAEMEGGVFTITNLGGIGGTSFTPIVNWPEVAILGISRSSLEPVFIDGKFEPRLMLPLSLSYDHRLIDGADAARFLRWVAEALEQLFLVPFEG